MLNYQRINWGSFCTNACDDGRQPHPKLLQCRETFPGFGVVEWDNSLTCCGMMFIDSPACLLLNPPNMRDKSPCNCESIIVDTIPYYAIPSHLSWGFVPYGMSHRMIFPYGNVYGIFPWKSWNIPNCELLSYYIPIKYEKGMSHDPHPKHALQMGSAFGNSLPDGFTDDHGRNSGCICPLVN